MNLDINIAIVGGNLTADPELKQTQQGTSVCSFTIAISRRFSRSSDQEQPTADFINIVAWRERAEFVAKHFKKGKPILVCGQLQTRTWSDKEGNRRTSTEVVADELTFVSGKDDDKPASDSGYAPEAYTASASAPAFEDVSDTEGLPF